MSEKTENLEKLDSEDVNLEEFESEDKHLFVYSNAVIVSVGPHDFRMRFYNAGHGALLENVDELSQTKPEVEIAMPLFFMAEIADILLSQISNLNDSGLLEVQSIQLQILQKVGAKKISLRNILEEKGEGEEQ